MPIQFTTATTPSQTVAAHVEVDCEGDLTLYLNGVEVLYLDNTNGHIALYKIGPNDRQKLHNAGIRLEGPTLCIHK